jgi:hypothetical protein
MQAHVGDELIVRGHHIGQADRKGIVVEAHGPDSTQPFLVKWDDDGHTTLFFPGSDCFVQHLADCG